MTTAPERAADYHADNEGRLSSTIAKALVLKTPAHAKAILDGRSVFESDALTTGTAVHQMLLRDDRLVVCAHDSWRTKDAREERDAVRARGLVPILTHQWDEAREIAQHVNGQILELGIEPTPFTKGQAEHVIRWDENGVKCRALLDWVRDDGSFVDDLKTTTDASPRKFANHIFRMGYDIQAAFYTRAVIAGLGVTPTFRWIVVEVKQPYPISVHTLTPAAMYAAQVKVDTALSLWRECLDLGIWPGYPNAVQEVDTPGWAAGESDAWADVDIAEVPF
jgi:hypothetical protein